MSDLELKDIGLTRSNITGAARGEARRDRASSLSCFSNAPDECSNQRQEAASGTQRVMAHVGQLPPIAALKRKNDHEYQI